MSHLWRHRRFFSSASKELGCGLITMLVFTAPLWAFSMATRGPRFAFTLLAGAILVTAVMVVVSRMFRRR